MSVQQLRERNNNAQDALRLQRLVEDHQEAAREENQRIEDEEEEHEKCAECPYLFLIGEWSQEVRGKPYCPACIEQARENDTLLFEENKAILYGLMEKYLIENHDLFVKAIEEYIPEEDEEDSRYETAFYSLLGGSAFVEFAVKNSDITEEMIESVIEEMFDETGYFDVDNLVEVYHELCNAPVLK